MTQEKDSGSNVSQPTLVVSSDPVILSPYILVTLNTNMPKHAH